MSTLVELGGVVRHQRFSTVDHGAVIRHHVQCSDLCALLFRQAHAGMKGAVESFEPSVGMRMIA